MTSKANDDEYANLYLRTASMIRMCWNECTCKYAWDMNGKGDLGEAWVVL